MRWSAQPWPSDSWRRVVRPTRRVVLLTSDQAVGVGDGRIAGGVVAAVEQITAQDLGLVGALEARDEFDVVGMREQITQSHPGQFVAVRRQRFEVQSHWLR